MRWTTRGHQHAYGQEVEQFQNFVMFHMPRHVPNFTHKDTSVTL
jgi:hypothetical protein